MEVVSVCVLASAPKFVKILVIQHWKLLLVIPNLTHTHI